MKVWIVWIDENHAYTDKVFGNVAAAVRHYGMTLIETLGIRFEEVEVIA